MESNEAILKCLLDNLDEGIHIVDKEGRTIFYNKSMGRMEGLKPEEVIGKRVVELLKGLKEEDSTLMNALKTKKKFTDILQHYNSNFGKEVTTINTTVPVVHRNEVIAALEVSKDLTQLKELNEKLQRLQNSAEEGLEHYTFNDIITVSEAITKEINKAKRAALSNSSVLIYGETGCGKELFAQSIHYDGLRRERPFLPINCAAIPSALLESILFGTARGSFTGAENKKGLFEEANRGTILLDEINSMEPGLQSKLLRVLQDGVIRPIGSSKDVEVDVRIIATLNEDPERLIKEGKLRKDFFYRLSVVRINIPPLRERKEDIPVLTNHFLKLYNRFSGRGIQSIDKEVLDNFLSHDWPGNIRELRNMIESAVSMAENCTILTSEHFDGKSLKVASSNESGIDKFSSTGLSLDGYLDYIERELISNVFERNGANITKTAEELKITRQGLQYKLKKYKLQ